MTVLCGQRWDAKLSRCGNGRLQAASSEDDTLALYKEPSVTSCQLEAFRSSAAGREVGVRSHPTPTRHAAHSPYLTRTPAATWSLSPLHCPLCLSVPFCCVLQILAAAESALASLKPSKAVDLKQLGTALLARLSPAKWQVLVRTGNPKEYRQTTPDESQVLAVLQHTFLVVTAPGEPRRRRRCTQARCHQLQAGRKTAMKVARQAAR